MGNFVNVFPLFGTHRRHYRLLSLLASGILWIRMDVVPKTFAWLLTVNIALYVFINQVSIVMSALMVEAGQRHQATGRLNAQRVVLSRLETLIATSLGPLLAKRQFRWGAGPGRRLPAALPSAVSRNLSGTLSGAHDVDPLPAGRAGVRN